VNSLDALSRLMALHNILADALLEFMWAVHGNSVIADSITQTARLLWGSYGGQTGRPLLWRPDTGLRPGVRSKDRTATAQLVHELGRVSIALTPPLEG